MTKPDTERKDGITIQTVFVLIILCGVMITGLQLYSVYRSSGIFSDLSRETGNYIVRQEAAHNLLEASDYLTENVQRFTLDGDTLFLDNYFEEALVSKRREASIVSMTELEAEQSIVQQLQEAMEESQALMYREYYAMKLVVEALQIRDYPDTLKAIELSEEDAFLTAQEKMDLAQQMVMGSEYYASKEIIRNKLKTSLENLDQMMNATRRESTARMMEELTRDRAVNMVLVLMLLILLCLITVFAVHPLYQASKSLHSGKPVPLVGSREFMEFADSYNLLLEEHGKKEKERSPEGTGEA